MNSKINSKEDVFKLLDSKLDEAERTELAKAEDLVKYHFTLGLWIRNYLIHKGIVDFYRLFCEDDESNQDENFIKFMHEDMISELVLEEYQKYLTIKKPTRTNPKIMAKFDEARKG